MESQKSKQGAPVFYRLVPKYEQDGLSPLVIKKKRILIGRSNSCDYQIPVKQVSSMHAVLDIRDGKIHIMDLESTNGTFVNSEKVENSILNDGDTIKISSFEMKLEKYENKDEFKLKVYDPDATGVIFPEKTLQEQGLLQELNQANESEGKNSKAKILEETKLRFDRMLNSSLPSLPNIRIKDWDKDHHMVQIPSYPLSKDAHADESEYIFEDADVLYPIFDYDFDLESVEVTLLYEDTVLSVEYPTIKNQSLYLVGGKKKANHIRAPFLGKKEKVEIIEIDGDQCKAICPPKFKMTHFSDGAVKKYDEGAVVVLKDEDFIRLDYQQFHLYLRRVSSPPVVTPPPFLGRDNEFWRILIPILILFTSLMVLLHVSDLDQEEIEEKKLEKMTKLLKLYGYKKKERVKIYTAKSKAGIKQTKKAAKKSDKKNNKPTAAKAPEPKKVDKQAGQTNVTKKKVEVVKDKTPPPVAKKSPKEVLKKVKPKEVAADKPTKKPVKKAPKVTKGQKKIVAKKAKVKQKVVRKKPGGRKAAPKSKRPSPTKKVAVKKAPPRPKVDQNMASALSLLDSLDTGKAASRAGRKAQAGVGSAKRAQANLGGTGQLLAGQKGSLSKGVIGGSGGGSSLKNYVRGRIGQGTDVGQWKKGRVNIPSVRDITVTKGIMDPKIIKRIIHEHIPHFESCYNLELRRNKRARQGKFNLDFTIGRTGRVISAKVQGRNFSRSFTTCVRKIVTSLRFPRPKGNGSVGVVYPLTFSKR